MIAEIISKKIFFEVLEKNEKIGKCVAFARKSLNTNMGLTDKQRSVLVNTHQIPDHLQSWCREIYYSNNISRVQYNTVVKLLDMSHKDKRKHLIIEDRLVLSVKRRKYYALTSKGWVLRKLLRG